MGKSDTRVLVEEIEARLGRFPALLSGAAGDPHTLLVQWRLARDVYLDGPVPAPLRDAIVRRLAPVLRPPLPELEQRSSWESSTPTNHGGGDVGGSMHILAAADPADDWPPPAAGTFVMLLDCVEYAVLHPGRESEARRAIAHYLGPARAAQLANLLAFLRAADEWLEAAGHARTDEDDAQAVTEDGGETQRSPLSEAMRALQARVSREEDRRRRAERRLDVLFARAPCGVFVTDPQGAIVDANPFAHAWLGYPRGGVAGRALGDLLAEQDRLEALERLAPLFEGRAGLAQGHWRVRTTRGELLWAELSAAPIVDRQGQLESLVVVMQDIGDLKRVEVELRSSHQFLDRILENIPDMVFVKEAGELRFVRFNAAGERLLGHQREALLGKNDYDFFPEEQAEFFTRKDREVLDSGGILDIPEEPIDTAQGQRWLHTKKIPILDPQTGAPTHLLGISRDITDLQAHARELAARQQELERSNRDLEQFAYVVSHDLQEPLRMVSNFMGLLTKRYRGDLDDRAQRYIDFAVEGSQRMQRLLQDLLVYSRVSTRRQSRVPVPVADVIDEATANLHLAIAETGAGISRAPELPTVEADRTQLVQVFQNLISNALKFRGAATPSVEVGCARDGDRWHITVRDNGIGFEQRLADQIFLIFQRLHGRDEYPGRGIGLAIVKRILERHGGTIRAESAPGEGATFHIHLPMRPEDIEVERTPVPT
jgi:PAS domain S-box-containing protein